MNEKRPQLQAGFILHHRPYRDTSLVLDVFSREAGRLAIVARGARQSRSRQRALLQPFRPLLLSWRLGGDMGTLTGVEADGPSLALTGERLLAGFYLNELVLRLLGRHDPNPEFFALYTHALDDLAEGGDTAPVLRAFEKRALDCLGYGLPLSTHALDGSEIQPDVRYRFDVQAGARPVSGQDSSSVGGETLLALYHETFDGPGGQGEMRRLLSSALAVHLGGRPLQTARVLRDLRRRGWGGNRERDGHTGEEQ